MLYLWALLFSPALCLVLCCVVALQHHLALHCVLALHCILSIVLALCRVPRHLHTMLHHYLQCVHSVGMVSRVDPLANVSGLPITCAVRH